MMTLENEFCQPMPAAAIAFAESLPFTTYTHGYAQEISLERDDESKYAPTSGFFYTDQTPPNLEPGEYIFPSMTWYRYDVPKVRQHTHCPYPVELLPPSHEECLLPPPIFEGQFIRHDVYDSKSRRRGVREYVSVQDYAGLLVWFLLSEWTLDNPDCRITLCKAPLDKS